MSTGALEDDEHILPVIKDVEFDQSLGLSDQKAVIVWTDSSDEPDLSRYQEENVILIGPFENQMVVCELMENLFLSMFLWKNRMREPAMKGDVPTFLDEASVMIGGSLALLDKDMSIIGNHGNSLASYQHSILDAVKKNRSQLMAPKRRSRICITACETGQHDLAVLSVRTAQGECFSVAHLADHEIEASFGMSCLDLVAEPLALLANALDSTQCGSEPAWLPLLRDIVLGERPADSITSHEMEDLGFKAAERFILFVTESGRNAAEQSQAQACLNNMDGCISRCFEHDGKLVTICNWDATVQNFKDIVMGIQDDVIKGYGLRTGSSYFFDSLSEANRAYRQASIALTYYDIVRNERAQCETGEEFALSQFVFALPYYLLNTTVIDRDAVDAYFANSPIELIYRQDQRTGTNVTKLIWTYLNKNCNVAATARLMYMHRNTVDYHIRKYENTFNIDLQDPLNRNVTILDFQHFFQKHGAI